MQNKHIIHQYNKQYSFRYVQRVQTGETEKSPFIMSKYTVLLNLVNIPKEKTKMTITGIALSSYEGISKLASVKLETHLERQVVLRVTGIYSASKLT